MREDGQLIFRSVRPAVSAPVRIPTVGVATLASLESNSRGWLAGVRDDGHLRVVLIDRPAAVHSPITIEDGLAVHAFTTTDDRVALAYTTRTAAGHAQWLRSCVVP